MRQEPGPARGFFLLEAGFLPAPLVSVERCVNKEDLGGKQRKLLVCSLSG